jgi:SNF family Na+-dependent transporter
VPVPATEPPAGHTPQRYRSLRRPSPGRTVLVAVMVAYALYAAGTTAFTRSANIATALPIVAVVVMVVVRWPLRPRRLTLGPDAGHPWRAWVCVFGAVVAWEVAEYAARGSRADHPTLSSMLDAVDRYYVLKALVFFLWLWLGAAIVRRGRPRPSSARPEPS